MSDFYTIFFLILSVFLGSVLGFLLVSQKQIKRLILTFSGAFLLTITALEIFPKVYSFGDSHGHHLGLFVLLGVFIQILLEGITKGAEHGHFHLTDERSFPFSIFIGLFIHSLLEGIPLHDHEHSHLLLAIVVHKIPVAMVLFIFISDITKSWLQRILFMTIFALASPIGWLIGDFINHDYIIIFMAIISGIFLHISTVILFESSDGHNIKLKKLLMLILGFVLGYATMFMH